MTCINFSSVQRNGRVNEEIKKMPFNLITVFFSSVAMMDSGVRSGDGRVCLLEIDNVLCEDRVSGDR